MLAEPSWVDFRTVPAEHFESRLITCHVRAQNQGRTWNLNTRVGIVTAPMSGS